MVECVAHNNKVVGSSPARLIVKWSYILIYKLCINYPFCFYIAKNYKLKVITK